MQIAQSQIYNPQEASSSSLSGPNAADWGYRIKLGDTAKKVDLDCVGPNSVAGGVVVAAGLSTTFNISTQDAMDANGLTTGAAIDASTSTIFAVYWCSAGDFSGGLGFSTTMPTRINGVYVLGAGAVPSLCRFIGWVRVNSAGNLTDSLQDRQIVNYYNRRVTPLYINPGYANDNAVTTYTRNSATWTTMRATAAESQCTFIGNGEDAASFTLNAMIEGAPTATVKFGIGLSTTQPVAIGSFSANAGNRPSSACTYTFLPTSGTLFTPQMLTVNSVNNATYVADTARDGAAADAPATLLGGWILA